MYNFFKAGKKIFKSTEEVISMFLGLVIVVVVISLIFSFFQRNKGDITVPGTISNQIEDEGNKAAEQENVYTVVYGDSLWKIAKSKYNDGNKWTELAKINNLKNPRVLSVGQKINLIKVDNIKEQILTNDNSKIKDDSTYTVVKNDNLWKISVKVYGDGYKWTKIWEANKKNIGNPSFIYTGTKLILPNLGS